MDRYANSFPAAAAENAHWTERVVTEGHTTYCRQHGHAIWTEDGVTIPRCPRCGAALDAALASVGIISRRVSNG